MFTSIHSANVTVTLAVAVMLSAVATVPLQAQDTSDLTKLKQLSIEEIM